MLTQISFKAPQNIKQSFASRVKDEGKTMSTLFLAFMEEYIKWNISIWLTYSKQRESDYEMLSPPADTQEKMNNIAKLSKWANSNKS